MTVVPDANALLVSIPPKSIYRPILDALIIGKFDLVISNDILSEYIEIIERKANAQVANNIAEMLLSLDNLNKVDIYFDWKLMSNDPDDNKYADASIVGSADYLVTNDHHFGILNSIDFPKVKIINLESFLSLTLQGL
jgi:predicted nucleic acid-binding protein